MNDDLKIAFITGDYYEHYSYPEESGRVDAKLLTKLAKTNIFGFATISCIFNSNRFYANVQVRKLDLQLFFNNQVMFLISFFSSISD